LVYGDSTGDSPTNTADWRITTLPTGATFSPAHSGTVDISQCRLDAGFCGKAQNLLITLEDDNQQHDRRTIASCIGKLVWNTYVRNIGFYKIATILKIGTRNAAKSKRKWSANHRCYSRRGMRVDSRSAKIFLKTSGQSPPPNHKIIKCGA
jgi:hypothetical protein